MDEEGITITDSTYHEPMSDEKARELKEYEQEKLRKAEEKEQAMLDADWERSVKRAERRKKFFEGIKRVFTKGKAAEAQQAQQANGGQLR